MTCAPTFTVLRHAVPFGPDGLSPLQARILSDPAPVRVFSAPTGAGKSYALFRAAREGKRVLFVVPTRRLAQNLAQEAAGVLAPLSSGGSQPVAIWSSDETQRQRALDPEYRPWQARVLQVTRFEDAQFIVATPESLASMLLHGASAGPGSNPFGISQVVQYFEHVVFDEFHSIDARGFGLCAVVARACTAPGVATRTTFLSATPIDLLPVLTTLGIEPEQVSVRNEDVLDHPPDGPLSCARVLHGDVRVRFVEQADMTELLAEQAEEVRACLARKRQIVLIFDSLEELHVTKDRLAALLDRMGIPAAERLAINSIDDSASMAPLDRLFVTDRAANPKDYAVLLATSSVEMGVTFKAGMLVMDPGHDALSFVQRVGRVARGDESGVVVVRVDPARLGQRPWLRTIMARLRDAPETPNVTVSRFLEIVLAATRNRFKAGEEVQSDSSPLTFRSMPQRAAWAACLFWHTLERGQRRHLKGQREALRGLLPAKVQVIAALLRTLEDEGGCAARWAQAFLKQAGTLRDIAPTITVVEPGGGRRTVPCKLISSRPELRMMPMVVDENDNWVLHLDRPLDAALRETTRVNAEQRRTVLLPDGQARSLPLREAVQQAISVMEAMCNAPGTTMRLEAQLGAAIKLVRLSGLIPEEYDRAPAEAGIV